MFNIFIILLLACASGFAATGGGGGGAPNVVTISPGANLATYNWQNDTAYQLGEGTYSPGTPSILMSNLMTRTAIGGILLASKTNITIRGVPGGTVIDGRTVGLGELLTLSNCLNIRIEGIEFRGHTNFNWANLPGFSPITTNAGAYIWGSIALMATCSDITFDNIWVNGSVDHGLWDYAASNGALFPNADTPSTNNIQVLNSKFSYCGSFRTNSTTPTTALPQADGTAIVPSGGGWNISGCYFDNNLRGIEPYDEGDAGGKLGFGTIITDCYFKNNFLFAIGPAGSTNAHSVLIANCKIINDRSFNFRGTNFGGANQDVLGYDSYGLFLNGGRGWHVMNTEVAGLWRGGLFIGNGSSFCDDFIIDGLVIRDIYTGTGGAGIGGQIGVVADDAASASSVRRLLMSNVKIINTEVRGFRTTACRDCTFENIDLFNAGVYTTASSANHSGISVGEDSFTVNNPTNVTLRNIRAWSGQNGAGAQAYAVFWAANVYSSSFENWFLVGQAENGGITNKSGSRVSFLGPIKNYAGTVDYAAIAANTAVDTVFTAVGVTTNDMVAVSVPPSIYTGGIAGGELLFGAWGTNSTLTDGQIVLRANNTDTGAATGNPNNSTFHFQARQVRIHGQ